MKLSLLHKLVRLSPPREDYQLSVTNLRDYNPLERIIISLSLPWGIITPWRGLLPLTRYPGGLSPPHLSNHYPGRLPTLKQSDLSSSFRVLHPLPLFRTIILVQLFASMVRVMVWEHWWQGTEQQQQKRFTRHYVFAQTKGISRNIMIVNQPTAQPGYLSFDTIWYYHYALCTVLLTHVSVLVASIVIC